MAELRDVVTSLGHADVATYIQSGNVVFSTDETDTAKLAKTLEDAIAAQLGVSPRVLVLSRDELAQVVRDNPYPGEPNHRAVHAVFREAEPDPGMVAAVAAVQQRVAAKGSRDSAQFAGRTLYLHTPDGFGRSELVVQLGRGQGPLAAKAAGTARNWATVTTLLAMCEDST